MSDPIESKDQAHKAQVHNLPIEEKDITVVAAEPIVVDGREYPTEEEEHTLRRVSDKIPWTAYTIAFVELCERFSYYGTTVVCMFLIYSGNTFVGAKANNCSCQLHPAASA